MATPGDWEDAGDQASGEAGAQAVLTALHARGIAVPDEVRERIQSEQDASTLERWLEKAVVASSVEDVVDDPN